MKLPLIGSHSCVLACLPIRFLSRRPPNNSALVHYQQKFVKTIFVFRDSFILLNFFGSENPPRISRSGDELGPVKQEKRSLEYGPLCGCLICPLFVLESGILANGEIEKGWIIQADTIDDLARKLNIDPSGVAEAVKNPNSHYRSGKDPEFDMPANSLAPLEALPKIPPNFC